MRREHNVKTMRLGASAMYMPIEMLESASGGVSLVENKLT
jgi:hypothetical protein